MVEMKKSTPIIPLPANFDGKDRLVFGNIDFIYNWHKE